MALVSEIGSGDCARKDWPQAPPGDAFPRLFPVEAAARLFAQTNQMGQPPLFVIRGARTDQGGTLTREGQSVRFQRNPFLAMVKRDHKVIPMAFPLQ